MVLLAACGSHEGGSVAKSEHRGVYHWKTTYNPTRWELQWMHEHEVDRLYIKLFDVEPGEPNGYSGWRMVPVATTRFEQLLPSDIDVVPVVYITLSAIEQMEDYDWQTSRTYAKLLVDRITAMMADHWSGTLREVQLDCDWTVRTRERYFSLCREVREILNGNDVELSGTVRLHQMGEERLPFDRTVLMVYNTGHLQSRSTRNSILDHSDVAPYLRKHRSPQLDSADVAWPAFGWGVAFHRNGKFAGLVHSSQLTEDEVDTLRVEWAEPKEIERVKRDMPATKGHTTIIYHLDSLNLSRYSHEEIEAIYGGR